MMDKMLSRRMYQLLSDAGKSGNASTRCRDEMLWTLRLRRSFQGSRDNWTKADSSSDVDGAELEKCKECRPSGTFVCTKLGGFAAVT